ncbi:hypothetical protein GLW20_02285 [Virgibacillus halodenitrificans]|nr:hypothetical protein [Virgibacillus halodenitrificans]
MQKIIVIVVKNGTKYQFGLDKGVNQVVNEIAACQSDFYQVLETCAIRKDEIVSVEQFEYNPEEGEANG